MSTNIRINHKGWVIFATPLKEIKGVKHDLVRYLAMYRGDGLTEDIFTRLALIEDTSYTLEHFKALPLHERVKVSQYWLEQSIGVNNFEEPEIVY